MQGDVLAIYTANGTLQAEYAYDAYGNCTVTNSTNSALANYNPIRYRGYYYDRETGLYYLNSRYYNPQWRRFISPDDTGYIDPENINGLNLYAYCGNDPVNYADPSGNLALSTFLVGLGISALIGATVGAASYTVGQLLDFAFTGDFEWSWGGFLGSTIGGAVGGIVAYVLPYIGISSAAVGAFVSGMATSAGTMIGENIAGDASHSFEDILLSSTVSGIFSAISIGIMSKIKISKLNAGRGSFSSISKQIFTKFKRQLIRKISIKTFGKMLAIETYNGIVGTILDGIYNVFNIN